MAAADPGPADVTDGPPRRHRHRRERDRRRWVAGLAYVVLLALIAGTAFVWLQLRADSAEDDERDEALAAARQLAVNLMSIDYRTAQDDLQRIVDGATGQHRTVYERQLESFPRILRQTKSVSAGEVLAAGLQSYDDNHAVVALAINQSVRSTETEEDIGTARRMLLDLEKVDGRWLVSKQTFVGRGVLL